MSAEFKRPLIVEIKRGCVHDGPGIRTVVFFKGCPLRCIFCHSPETQNPGPELAFSRRDCIECGRCVQACPEGAIDLNNPLRIDREKCNLCGECVKVCPGSALRMVGTYYEPSALVELLLRDIAFYKHSGGGVTLSGGECLLFPEYLEAVLQPLKARGVHTLIETAGGFDYEVVRRHVLPYTDIIYYDIKFADAEDYERFTGHAPARILENFKRLLSEPGISVLPRVPLIPGVTATRPNLEGIIRWLYQAGAKRIAFLPYNPMGLQMHELLGRPKPSLPERFMTPEEEASLHQMIQALLQSMEGPSKEDPPPADPRRTGVEKELL